MKISISIEELERWTNEDYCLVAVRSNGSELQYVEKQTAKICLAAVKDDGNALQYVKDQTEAICLAAVKQNGDALQYVKKQTEAICLEAVKQNGYNLQYVKEPTEAIYLAAVKQNGYTLELIMEPTEILCLEAVKQNGHALRHVNEQTEAICLAAVKESGSSLQFLKKQTEAVCLEAVKKYGEALQFVKQQTEDICLAAVKKDGYALRYVNEQTEAICLAAVKKDGYALKYVKEQTEAICISAVECTNGGSFLRGYVTKEFWPIFKDMISVPDYYINKEDSTFMDFRDSQKLLDAGFSLNRQTPEYTSYKVKKGIGTTVSMICTIIHFKEETPSWVVRYDIKANHKEGQSIANTKVVTGSFKTVGEAIEMYQAAKLLYGTTKSQTQNLPIDALSELSAQPSSITEQPAKPKSLSR